MKTRLFSLIAAVLLLASPNATAQKVILNYLNGETLEVDVYSLESITFEDGERFVDLELPSGTLWASRNIGANSIESFGDFFAWGETQTKSSYTEGNYKFFSNREVTKYNATDGLTELLAADDAAMANFFSIFLSLPISRPRGN